MTQARRVDDQLVLHGDSSGPAMTVREMILDHDRRIDRIEHWMTRTEVYERLLKWVLAVAASALVVGVVNLLLSASQAGVVK